MSEDTIRLATVGRLIYRRRRLLALLTLVGALVGYGASVLFPPRYTATASVVLPGAWEERELLTQAAIADSSVVVDQVAAALDWPGVDGRELREDVSAGAADGNIIEISGTADTPERAQRLSDQAARQYVAFAAGLAGDGTAEAERPESLRQLVVRTSRRITELAEATDPGQSVESVQTRTELTKLRTALQEAGDRLEEADPVADRAALVVMGPAARPDGEAPPTRAQLVVGGGLLFFLSAVVGQLTAARMSRRPRTEPETAAALGTTPLGTVDVPEDPKDLRHAPAPRDGEAPRAADPGPRARLRRLLGLDTRWDVPTPRASGDETGRQARYRRVHARLQARLPGRRPLLVLVPEGDAVARSAAGRLAATAGDAPPPGSPGTGRPALRVVEVSVARPWVPDRDEASGAVVVLSAGSRTTEELAGVAEACADAGHEVVGVVLAGPVRPRPARSAADTRDAAAPGRPVAEDAKGAAT
ncbi:Wzz/FepE/Etk N-terminal domain-containing protein [Streptomyces chumphonensis]|uniref:Polysaccharide biosynthesis protein n=1 Tax=Streptomyces chumphonensis TaxID=1214925 RepID=A0A927F011_9ACTN|nr:polysaccharide biosynthesis protein [Streptomyces chumphonensis]MBD3932726.1 polysaccharide biosynthesis protein [Streptomyces chumphonensis]